MNERKKTSIGMPVAIGVIICAMICILNVDSKLVNVIGGMVIGSHIMLVIDIFQKRRRD